MNKSAKYEELGKDWSYCTRNRAITNAHCSYCDLVDLQRNIAFF